MFNTREKKSPGKAEPTMVEDACATEETATTEEPATGESIDEQAKAHVSFTEELEIRLDEIGKLNEKFLRKCAEVENFKKRLQKEKTDAIIYANSAIVKDILTVTDNLERALEHCKDGDSGSLKGGVELTLKNMYETLAKHGVSEIKAEGEKFDPKLHEAVSHEEKDGVETDTVTTVFQKGFMLKDKLLRPALVIVAK